MELECGAAQSNGACDRDGDLVAMGFEGWLGHEERVGRLNLAHLERLVRGAEYGICGLCVMRASSSGSSLRFDGQSGTRGEKRESVSNAIRRQTYSGGFGLSISSTISGGSSSRRKCCCWCAMETGRPPWCCVAIAGAGHSTSPDAR